jgi:hypothetical protein
VVGARAIRRPRGSSAVEYLVVIVLFAITGVAAYRAFGHSVRCKMATATGLFSGGGAPAGCSDDGSGGSSGPVASNDPPAGSGPSSSVTCVGGVCSMPGKCFVAGTLVETEFGPRPIETIVAGTRVLAGDGAGATAWKPVVRTFTRTAEARLRLVLGTPDDDGAAGTSLAAGRRRLSTGELLELTPDHRLYAVGRGWVAARELEPGVDALVNDEGAPVPLRSGESIAGPTTVFNLEVADLHSYFVGAQRLLAHNDCGDDAPGPMPGAWPADPPPSPPTATPAPEPAPTPTPIVIATPTPSPSPSPPPSPVVSAPPPPVASGSGATSTPSPSPASTYRPLTRPPPGWVPIPPPPPPPPELTLTLYADPAAGSTLGGRLPDRASVNTGYVGHAFVGLESSDWSGPKYYGFWPQNGYDPSQPWKSVPGEINTNDTSHLGGDNVTSTTYHLTPDEWANVNTYMGEQQGKPYNLFGWKGGHSCVTFARGCVRASGHKPPAAGPIPNPNGLHHGIDNRNNKKKKRPTTSELRFFGPVAPLYAPNRLALAA